VHYLSARASALLSVFVTMVSAVEREMLQKILLCVAVLVVERWFCFCSTRSSTRSSSLLSLGCWRGERRESLSVERGEKSKYGVISPRNNFVSRLLPSNGILLGLGLHE
jgi:hypothetical protein